MTKKQSLDKLLKPRSIAVIGASNDPGRSPGMSLHYIKQAGFDGPIWPVNPNRDTVQGLKAYASIADLPGVPDVAVITTPAQLVQPAVEELAARGVGAVVIFAIGFGEADEAGRKAQEILIETAGKAGMRVLGPNCLGCFSPEVGFYGTISISLSTGLPKAGNIAIVSQSGSHGEQIAYLFKKRGIGVRYLVTTGNESDVDVGESIAWLADQDDVDVIVGYSEGVSRPAQFVEALARAKRNGKRVIYVKVGRSAAGMAAAASHTASLAGDDRFWDALLHRHGAYRVGSMEEQLDVAYAAARGLLPAGRKLGILTVSGGLGITLCDAAAKHGLEVPPLPEAAAAELRTLLPQGSISNPVDASGQIVADLEKLKGSLVCMAQKAGFDFTVTNLGSVPLGDAMGPAVVKALVEAAPHVADRIVVLCCVAEPETVRTLEAAGYLVFEDVEDAARALAGLVALAEGAARPEAPKIVATGRDVPDVALSEFEAKRLLAEAGLPVLDERLAKSADEAVAAAEAIGYPVVLKICSPQILHKTEIGGIILSVTGPDAVRQGFDELVRRAAAAGFARDVIDGVLVAPMARKGVETILGIQVDPAFGPAVIFGMGGIHVEVLKDSAMRLAPIDEREAHEMIREIRAYPILKGVRGERPADIDVLAKAISALSRFAAANAAKVSTVDINPFVVWEDGAGAAALDALVVSASGGADGGLTA